MVSRIDTANNERAGYILNQAEEKLSSLFGFPVYLSHNAVEREAIVNHGRVDRTINKAAVMSGVCEWYAVDVDDVRIRRGRKPQVIKAKRMFFYLSYRVYSLGSSKELSRYAGLKDHATCLHHVSEMEGFMSVYESVRKEVEFVRELIEKH